MLTLNINNELFLSSVLTIRLFDGKYMSVANQLDKLTLKFESEADAKSIFTRVCEEYQKGADIVNIGRCEVVNKDKAKQKK